MWAEVPYNMVGRTSHRTSSSVPEPRHTRFVSFVFPSLSQMSQYITKKTRRKIMTDDATCRSREQQMRMGGVLAFGILLLMQVIFTTICTEKGQVHISRFLHGCIYWRKPQQAMDVITTYIQMCGRSKSYVEQVENWRLGWALVHVEDNYEKHHHASIANLKFYFEVPDGFMVVEKSYLLQA